MYKYNGRVRYSEVGPDGVLTLASVMNYFQDTSTFQSEDGGVGLDYLFARNMGWFVTNYDIQIFRLPKMGEHLELVTIPYLLRGLMGQRTYEIRTVDGELLVCADALWVLMDLQKNSPARITEEMAAAYPLDPKPEYVTKRAKLKEDEGLETVGSFTVETIYLDSNNHMNNANYIDVTSKFLPEGFEASFISINFKKPAQLKETFEVKRAAVEGGYQVALVRNGETYTLIEYKGK